MCVMGVLLKCSQIVLCDDQKADLLAPLDIIYEAVVHLIAWKTHTKEILYGLSVQ